LGELRISHDRASGLWGVRHADRMLCTKRVVIHDNVKFRSSGNALVCSPVPDLEGDTEKLRIGRHIQHKGVVKVGEMREWRVVFDENVDRWVIWKQDDPSVMVSTSKLEIDCHVVSRPGEAILRCLAEMLVDGRTNRRQSFPNARVVRLRTLVMFDQKINIPFIKVSAAVRSSIV
jgi:hypothetical protein